MITAVVSMLSTPVFAQEIKGNVLDLDTAINNAVKNSYIIKQRESILESTERSCKDQVKMANNIDKRIKDNERFKELIGKNERTKEEEAEYQVYVRMYGKPMSYDELTSYSKTSNIVPVKNKFTIFQYTNALQVAKNNIKQNVYEEYGKLIKAKDDLDLAEKKFNVAESEFKKVNLNASLGIISKLEGNEKKSDYLKEKENYEKLKRELKIQTMNFNRLIGVPINTEYSQFTKEYSKGTTSFKSYEEYVNEALKNRAEIVNGKEYIYYKEYERDLSSGSNFEKREKEIGQQYLETARDTVEIKKLDIQLEVKRLYDDLEVKYKNFESISNDYKEAKKSYDEISTKYSIGVISKIEYDKETATFTEKMLNYLNKDREIFISKLKLENACSLGTDINKGLY